MKKNIKLFTLPLFVMLFSILMSCHMPDNSVAPGMKYTLDAETRQAKMDQIASLTPPTPTATITPSPTETLPPTETLTPTIQPTPTWITQAKGSAKVFILMYNDIASSWAEDPYYQWESEGYVPAIEFEQQVRILHELGYTSIGISDLVKILREGGELPQYPVMFTFDSTELGQYKNAYPILKKYGFMGNLFVEYKHIDAKNSLSTEQIKEMISAGWEIGCQGYEGNGMGGEGLELRNQEIGKPKAMIESLLGVDVLAFAYPGGYIDPEGKLVNAVVSYGYFAAFGKARTIDQSLNNLYYLGRYEIFRGENYATFLEKLPWKVGNISNETMIWTLPTETVDPASLALTLAAPTVEPAPPVEGIVRP